MSRKFQRILIGLAVSLMSGAIATVASAKIPGKTHCYGSVCHRVLTLSETQAEIGRPRSVHASHYDDPSRDRFNPSLQTSSGELFKPWETDNAASPVLPNGTQVAVYNPATKRGAIIRINNSGPYWGNRTLDLSRGLADKLGFGGRGVAKVVVEVLKAPTPQEAKYSRNRSYKRVPGFVGQVAGMDTLRSAFASCAGSDHRWPKCSENSKRPPGRALPAANVNIVAAVAGVMRDFGCLITGGGNKACAAKPETKPGDAKKGARRSRR